MKVINDNIYSSKGKLKSIEGVVIHNDASSINATPSFYKNWLRGHPAENGFAHRYVNRDEVLQVAPLDQISWHSGNTFGNQNLLSYEVCQSMGASDTDFLANEQATFKQIANDLKSLGKSMGQIEVYLHRALSATACPHRSWDLHVGKGASNTESNRTKLVNYFWNEINKHYSGASGSTSVSQNNPTNIHRIAKQGTFKPNTTMNVRRTPTTAENNIVATYHANQAVFYDSFCDVNGYRWISYIGGSGNRNYIAYQQLSNGKLFGTW